MELKCSLVRILGTAGADEQGPTHQSRDIWAGSRGRRVSAPLRTLAARIGPILRWAGKLHFQCLEGCAGGVIVRGQREVPNRSSGASRSIDSAPNIPFMSKYFTDCMAETIMQLQTSTLKFPNRNVLSRQSKCLGLGQPKMVASCCWMGRYGPAPSSGGQSK